MSSFASSGLSISHSSHIPYHDRLRHLALLVGGVSVSVAVGAAVVEGSFGGSVIVDCGDVVVPLVSVGVGSLHPQNLPGVRHVAELVVQGVVVGVV